MYYNLNNFGQTKFTSYNDKCRADKHGRKQNSVHEAVKIIVTVIFLN